MHHHTHEHFKEHDQHGHVRAGHEHEHDQHGYAREGHVQEVSRFIFFELSEQAAKLFKITVAILTIDEIR